MTRVVDIDLDPINQGHALGVGFNALRGKFRLVGNEGDALLAPIEY